MELDNRAMELDRRAVLEAMVGAGVLAATWPACRSNERDKKNQEGFFATLPSDVLDALTAAVEHVLPGAVAAGAMVFLDYWLQQRPISNLQPLFKNGGLVLNIAARSRFRKKFDQCSDEERDEVLKAFASGTAHPKLDSKRFLEQLTIFTLESFLGDPKYGGNKNTVGWKFINWEACWWSPKKVGLLVEPDERLPY